MITPPMLKLDVAPWLGHGFRERLLNCKRASFFSSSILQGLMVLQADAEHEMIWTLALCRVLVSSNKPLVPGRKEAWRGRGRAPELRG